MLKNYLIIAVRNIAKNKTFSVINVIGLAVGVALFLLISLFVINEFSYDKFNEKVDRTYRIYVHSNINGQESNNSKSPGLMGPRLKRDFPEIETYTRVGWFGQHNFTYEEKSFRESNIYGVDSTYFDVFTLPFIKGNPKTALKKPGTLVITESTEKKYFGKEDALGKILHTDKQSDFIITGVMKDFPKNSHFKTDFLSSIYSYPQIEKDYWLELWYSTYLVLKKGTDPIAFENKLTEAGKKYITPSAEAVLGSNLDLFLLKGNIYQHKLQPLSSVYLYSQRKYGIDLNTEWGDIKTSDIVYCYVLGGIAIFILLIAVINFINLTTAKAERRAKEVGIRKTVGSSRFSLVIQFFTESILMSFLSVLLGLIIMHLILPLFNSFTGHALSLEYFNNLYSIPIIVGFILILGILAGMYPAFYLSSFAPSHILKSNIGKGSQKGSLRGTLVILQFSITIILLIGTIIIKNQLDYLNSRNLGFNKERLVILNDTNLLGNNYEIFKNDILKNPGILSASLSSRMFDNGIAGHGYLFNKMTGTDPLTFQFLNTDYDFIKSYQMKIADGRFFSKEFITDSNAVVINQAAVREIGRGNPIGKKLVLLGTAGAESKPYNIIGIVEDFNYESLHQKVRPLALHLRSEFYGATVIALRLSGVNVTGTMAYVNETWNKFVRNNKINYSFLDQNLARLYETEGKINILVGVFTFLSIFIACIGLFGLASFVTEQRVKEIGIRKTLGASVFELVVLLSTEFTKWVIISNIIAWPVAYYFMNKWLQNFAYKVAMEWWVFLAAAASALLIAIFTVSYQALSAATANPVNSLKNE